jgi:hypothetical protein
MKAVMAVKAKEANDYEDEGIKEEEDHNTAMEDEEFEENSTIMSGMDDGEFKDIEIKFEWEEEIKDCNWAPMARAHRNVIKLLAKALKTSSRTSAKELRAFEQRMKSDQGPNDLKARAALQALVCKHNSLAEAVTAALDGSDSVAEDVKALQDEMNKFYQELQDYAAAANVSNRTILQVIAKMQEMLNSRHAEVRARVSRLEAAMTNFHPRPPSPPPVPRVPSTLQTFAGIQGIDSNTPLGVATVGGSKVVISANYLFGMIKELQAKVNVLMEGSKNTGVIFGQLAFASESEFTYWMASLNPSGAGLAGFVDMISLWAFAAGDSIETSTWLNEAHLAKSVGLKGGNADAVYVHSMMQCHPKSFIGKDMNLI